MSDLQWWQGAVIYQVYPRSLQDSNGDGIGDIPGIISRLDHIASLGVDAIWVSPFFKSPMKDFGYDISDYRHVDPIFGTNDDFDTLIAEAHNRGIKIMIDQVLSHTSDQHAWFKESKSSRDNPKSDWYVWADSKPDGSPPNNWLSIFGGVAWQWDSTRMQYYLHNFLTEQPDLNFHNPDVQNQILEEVEYWLKKGVDGLRLDAINFCFHDQELRDNPAKPVEERAGRGFSEDNPYAYQYHYYNNTRPEMIGFLQRLRSLLDQYPGSVALGEISSEDSLQTMAEYTADGDKLHMAYSFELLVDDYSSNHIRSTVENLEKTIDGGWPCWAISNHDVRRVLTRWGGENPKPEMSKMLTAMLSSLKGSVCTYQGEELGFEEADVAYEDLQDPYGITFWPTFKGRDGCRTPMVWEKDSEFGGFSSVKPWLPVSDKQKLIAADQQEQDEKSVLNQFRRFMAWRKQHPTLLVGDIEFIDSPESVLMFYRIHEGKKLLVAFNLFDQAVTADIPEGIELSKLSGHGFKALEPQGGKLNLPEYGAYFANVS